MRAPHGTATFELQPPTGNGVLLVDSTFIGGDPAGGGTDLDGTLYEDLSGPIAASGATAHPNQGFHIRLTVEAQGSIGAMTKHKTFWVTDCGGGERRRAERRPGRRGRRAPHSRYRAGSFANASDPASCRGRDR